MAPFDPSPRPFDFLFGARAGDPMGDRSYTFETIASFVADLIGSNPDSPLSGGEAIVNASGDSTLTIPASRKKHLAIVTFSGAPRTSEIVIPVVNRVIYDVVGIRLVNGSLSGVVERFRNGTASGTILNSVASDDGNGYFEFYFDGIAWQPLSNAQPVV